MNCCSNTVSPLAGMLDFNASSRRFTAIDAIRVATYLTDLPPKALLEQKLRTAAELARTRLTEAEA
jgi:hypothetical protein